MSTLHALTLDRAGAHEANAWVGPIGKRCRDDFGLDLQEPQPARIESTWALLSRLIEWIRCGLLLSALAVFGPWQAAAFALPPAQNRVLLSWDSFGPGTQYFVQTSTDLVTWTNTTNTTATNVSLAFTGNKTLFRLSASNAPPQSVTFAWDPAAPAAGIAGYSIYYGAGSGGYTNRVNFGLVTTGAISNLAAGTTYHFAMTTYTSTGLESDFSNEVSWRSAVKLRIQRYP